MSRSVGDDMMGTATIVTSHGEVSLIYFVFIYFFAPV